MKVVFMGTPDFSVSALEAILDAGHQVAAVVTQPDKPKGRGKEMQYSPVKICALKHEIPVFQPAKVKTPEAVEQLRSYGADVFVVVAFGQILSEEILNMPRFGCVNIHASLLPKYRGAAPIQWAVINGDKETGVTIIQMDKGVDTGDMLMKEAVPVDERETGESLFDKLSAVGARLIVKALDAMEKGEIHPEKQDDSKSCYAGMLKKEMGHICWDKPAEKIERLVRGLNSWPSAYTVYRGKKLKIWESFVGEGEADGKPGSISEVGRDAVWVNTGEGRLKVTQVQLEGKKRMAVKDFLLGYTLQKGEGFEC